MFSTNIIMKASIYLTLKFLIFLNFVQINHCSRILAVIPTPSFSHQIVFQPLLHQLAQRGHEVVVLTTDPTNSSIPNLKEINLQFAYNYWNSDQLVSGNPLQHLQKLGTMFEDVLDYELSHPEVNNIINNKTEHFDLVIVEALVPLSLVFGHHFKCPFVGVITMDAPTPMHYLMGNPVNPVLYPDFQIPLVPPLSFFERVLSFTVFGIMTQIGRLYLMPPFQKMAYKYFGDDIPEIQSIARDMSLLFINTNPIFNTVRPLGPTTIEIGGGAHIASPKKLPKKLKDFLDGCEDAIYFSLGTNVKSSVIGQELKQVFVDTFNSLPQFRVLWKFDGEVKGLSENVSVIKWGPQQDILRHKNVKLFITQGGLQSTQEAIQFGKPMVVLPFLIDQFGNSKRITNKGYGLALDKNKLDTETLKKSILEVIKNSKYVKAVTKAAKLIHDQPMTSVEKMVWWSEYVIRNNGTEHLRNHAADIPLYQVLGLDIFVSIYLIYKVIRLLFWKIRGFFKQQKVKRE